jgi:hypothetical protein
MKVKLADIASIQVGRSYPSDPSGEGRLVSVRDFDAAGLLLKDKSMVRKIDLSAVKANQLLQADDILLTAKGNSHRAYFFEGIETPCLASPVFLVIRVSDQQVLPAFIYATLSMPTFQAKLESLARGSTISNLSAKTVRQLEVVVPSISTQQAIVEVVHLNKKRMEVLGTLQRLYSTQINAIVHAAVTQIDNYEINE